MAAPGAAEEVLLFSTLSILQLLKESQQQHGLRHGDYQRYRSYCARRLRRIRKSLHFTNVQKHKSTFQGKTITPEVASVEARYLLIPLFEAERCWAYAMQLKQEANTEPRKKFYVLNKLKKAVKHSQELENLCKSLDKVDAPTKLESQAYNAWLHGCLEFERKQWATAMEYLNTSKKIYENLANVVTHGENSTLADVYHQRCQEMAPQLRYCAFNIGDASAGSVDELLRMRAEIHAGGDQQENLIMASDLDKLIEETRHKQATSAANKMAAEVTWCGHKIATDKIAKVQSFMTNLQPFDGQLKQAENADAKLDLYERLLIDCRDAIQAVRDDAKNENLKTKRAAEDGEQGQVDNQPLTPAQLLHSYLLYVRLSKTVDRYLLIIDQIRSSEKGQQQTSVENVANDAEVQADAAGGKKMKRKKQLAIDAASTANAAQQQSKGKSLDLVRLYDTVLQNLNEIIALPGVQHDQKFIDQLEAKMAYFRSFRCHCVAESFSNQKKWREALALYDRTLDYVQKAKQALKKSKITDNKEQISVNALDELSSVVNSAKCCTQANSILEAVPNAGTESNVSDKSEINNKPVMETLNFYRRINPAELTAGKLSTSSAPLVRLPPDFEPMACKPMFFDLALNHVQFPSLAEKLEAPPGEGGAKAGAEAGGKGGLTGIMKGWFWGSKK